MLLNNSFLRQANFLAIIFIQYVKVKQLSNYLKKLLVLIAYFFLPIGCLQLIIEIDCSWKYKKPIKMIQNTKTSRSNKIYFSVDNKKQYFYDCKSDVNK